MMIVQYIPISAEGKTTKRVDEKCNFTKLYLSFSLLHIPIFNVKWKKILMRMLLNAAKTRLMLHTESRFDMARSNESFHLNLINFLHILLHTSMTRVFFAL